MVRLSYPHWKSCLLSTKMDRDLWNRHIVPRRGCFCCGNSVWCGFFGWHEVLLEKSRVLQSFVPFWSPFFWPKHKNTNIPKKEDLISWESVKQFFVSSHKQGPWMGVLATLELKMRFPPWTFSKPWKTKPEGILLWCIFPVQCKCALLLSSGFV